VPRKKIDPASIFDVSLVQPVVEARTGEVRVQVTNPTSEELRDVTLRFEEITGEVREARRFAIIPSVDDGGYVIPVIEPGGTASRTFCLRPVQASVGSVTEFEASLEPRVSDDGKRIAAARLPELKSAAFVVRVEARPEMYAAVGAAEWLRDSVLRAYDELQQKGRTTYQERGFTRPGMKPVDAPRVVLSEKTFETIFQAIEVGVRIADGIVRRSGSGDGGGKS
jgi:hypothetical protein